MFCWPWAFIVQGIHFRELRQPWRPAQAKQNPSSLAVSHLHVPYVADSYTEQPLGSSAKELENSKSTKEAGGSKADTSARKTKLPREQKRRRKAPSLEKSTSVRQAKHPESDETKTKVEAVTEASGQRNTHKDRSAIAGLNPLEKSDGKLPRWSPSSSSTVASSSSSSSSSSGNGTGRYCESHSLPCITSLLVLKRLSDFTKRQWL